MVTLTILVQFAVLYGLIVFVWQLPFTYRLLLGLIITWPTLGLYGELELPAGIPDLNFQRTYVALLMLGVFISMVLAKRRAATCTIETAEKNNLQNDIFSRGYGGLHVTFPLWVVAYIVLKGLAVVNGLVFGSGGSTSITGYIETTLIPVGIYFLVKRFVDSRERLLWLLGAIVLSALIVLSTGLYERVLSLDVSVFPVNAHNDIGDTRTMDVPGGRAAGVIGNPAVFGGLMGMALLCTLCIGVNANKIWLKTLLGWLSLCLAYGVFVSFTRSAWLSVVIALAFSQFYFSELWRVTLPLAVFAAVVLLVVWGTLQQSDVVQDRMLNKETVTGRIDRFVWSWKRFVERPIIGRGPGALNELMQEGFAEDGFNTSHNTYMTMLVDNGGLVFLCYWGIVFGWLANAKSTLMLISRDSALYKRTSFERSAVAAMVGCLIIYLLAGMSLELSYFSYYSSMFWIAGAVVERLANACTPFIQDAELTGATVAKG